MVALSMHAVFEGLAVGVMDMKNDVFSMAVAITLHKGAEAMALVKKLQIELTCTCFLGCEH